MTMTEAQVQRLWQWLQSTGVLEGLSNAELADLLVETVWAELPVCSPQSDLISEVIERLRRAP